MPPDCRFLSMINSEDDDETSQLLPNSPYNERDLKTGQGLRFAAYRAALKDCFNRIQRCENILFAVGFVCYAYPLDINGKLSKNCMIQVKSAANTSTSTLP